MAASIATSGSFIPTVTNTPIDARIVLNYKSEISSIIRPYVGMIFYVKAEDTFYVVTSLKASSVAGIVVGDTAVNEYRPLIEQQSANITFASTEEVMSMLRGLGLTN